MPYSTDEIAKGARTTLRGVRLWESAGLLGDVPRNDQDHRVFNEDHMKRARVISAAQMAGMSIGEIRGAMEGPMRLKIFEAAMFMVETTKTMQVSSGFDL